MTWHIQKRRLGRAGGLKERMARQRQWDQTYGDGMWEIGYLINGDFVPQRDALDSIYTQSYRQHFDQHPEDLQELIQLGSVEVCGPSPVVMRTRQDRL